MNKTTVLVALVTALATVLIMSGIAYAQHVKAYSPPPTCKASVGLVHPHPGPTSY